MIQATKVRSQTSIATFPRHEPVHIPVEILVASFPGPHGLTVTLAITGECVQLTGKRVWKHHGHNCNSTGTIHT